MARPMCGAGAAAGRRCEPCCCPKTDDRAPLEVRFDEAVQLIRGRLPQLAEGTH